MWFRITTRQRQIRTPSGNACFLIDNENIRERMIDLNDLEGTIHLNHTSTDSELFAGGRGSLTKTDHPALITRGEMPFDRRPAWWGQTT
jgi:hypothetical protein